MALGSPDPSGTTTRERTWRHPPSAPSSHAPRPAPPRPPSSASCSTAPRRCTASTATARSRPARPRASCGTIPNRRGRKCWITSSSRISAWRSPSSRSKSEAQVHARTRIRRDLTRRQFKLLVPQSRQFSLTRFRGSSTTPSDSSQDGQSTDGTEPSHRHTRDDLSCSRGYELFLIKEALRRNPNVLVYGLSWATPGWVNNGTYYGPDQIDYQTSWVKCIQAETGKVVDYMGRTYYPGNVIFCRLPPNSPSPTPPPPLWNSLPLIPLQFGMRRVSPLLLSFSLSVPPSTPQASQTQRSL